MQKKFFEDYLLKKCELHKGADDYVRFNTWIDNERPYFLMKY